MPLYTSILFKMYLFLLYIFNFQWWLLMNYETSENIHVLLINYPEGGMPGMSNYGIF